MTPTPPPPQQAAPNALRLLAEHFTGQPPADTTGGTAAELITTGTDGWPHAAMIGIGELVVDAASGRCALALWTGTRTAGNLARDGRALLLVVLAGHAIRARLRLATARPADDGDLPGGQGAGGRSLEFFTGAVEQATAEQAPYARLAHGVEFELTAPGPTLARWRETGARLAGLLR